MCGISGIVYLGQISGGFPEDIRRMTDAIKHRGPDDEGYFFVKSDYTGVSYYGDDSIDFENKSISYCPKYHVDTLGFMPIVALSHRRLSILDLSEYGHLPMCDFSQKIWLTFNGEIYNYKALKHQLEALGCVFVSSSDSEVILYSYKIWGQDCVSHFNGMWSFVIWDEEKRSLFGSRDRTGVKPFYYTINDTFFAFASEIKSLLTIKGFNKKIDKRALEQYINNAEIEVDGATLFSEVKELLPGANFTYSLIDRHLSVEKYFSPDMLIQRSLIFNNELDAINELEKRVYDSIDIRLNADVSVGFCLSGGIDSSSIVGVANHINLKRNVSQLGEKMTAFTAINGFDSCDESKWASQVANQCQLNWNKAFCDSTDLKNRLEEIIYFQDSPLCSTSTYAQNTVLKKAHEYGLKIMLDGQGGDELFGGYPVFYYSYIRELLKDLKLNTLKNELQHQVNSPISYSFYIKHFIKHLMLYKKDLYVQLFKPELKLLRREFFNLSESISTTEDLSTSFSVALKDYTFNFYLKNLLRWEDRCAMQYSIESRTPFADDIRLLELAFSLPNDMKIKNGWSKYGLRQSMKSYVPLSILNRTDKLGFSTPQSVWLIELQDFLKEIIVSIEPIMPIMNLKLVFRDWDLIFSDSKYYREQQLIWRYANYLLWQKQFMPIL